MKRVILDTNIYGELILDKDYSYLKERIKELVVVHGFNIIRNELRDVPRKVKLKGKNLRISLLHIYDELTKRNYPISLDVEDLCNDYYKAYRLLGGSKSLHEMQNDLLIVACATLHEVDIVVSEDNKSMLSENSLRAYKIVNAFRDRRMPSFVGYLEFKRWLDE